MVANRAHRVGELVRIGLISLALLGAPAACATDVGTIGEDGEFDVAVGAGKADGDSFTDCELDSVVDMLNSEATDYDALRAGGVHKRASENLMEARDEGTVFADIEAVDDVSWVGPSALRSLVSMVADECTTTPPGDSDTSAVFSPQSFENSHLARVVDMIDAADRSIDIAMYSFRVTQITDALEDAVDRGVRVRFIFESAKDDRRDPEGTTSAKLEEAGVEVRYMNRIMHHKFMIVDGPQDSTDQAAAASIASGSGNWSSGAASVYDENTVFIANHAEFALQFQQEFNTVWNHSRPVVWNEDIEYFESIEITDADIEAADDPDADVLFTSDNFRTYESSSNGWTFSLERDRGPAVEREIVRAIEAADDSILISSGHMRSRPIAEALIAKHNAEPGVEIRVYLDGQEYVSYSGHRREMDKRESCESDAASSNWSERRLWECELKGMRYAYLLMDAGIDVRFKYYAYYWHYSFPQMHNKYLIIDDTLYTGSYNLSFNAEYETLENVMVFGEDTFPDLVGEYRDNFDELFTTNQNGALDDLLSEVRSGDRFPLLFDAISLSWQQISDLKSEMAAACPNGLAAAYANPQSVRYCTP